MGNRHRVSPSGGIHRPCNHLDGIWQRYNPDRRRGLRISHRGLCARLAAPNQTLGDGEANLTDGQWIKYKIMLMIKNQVIKGQDIRISAEIAAIVAADVVDPNIIVE